MKKIKQIKISKKKTDRRDKKKITNNIKETKANMQA